MYIIKVEPLSDIKPRMYPGGFENRRGDLRTTASVLAGIGKLRTVEPNPILLESLKESLS
jgi:hypothetical protein